MDGVIRGRAFVYGRNIDTDQIYPGRFLELVDPAEVGKHAMEGVDPAFVKEVEPGDLIVASTNFGCGSSREQAAITLKAAGVGAVIAESFGRIFYRNGINLGIPLVVCPGISRMVRRGDVLAVDPRSGDITNESTKQRANAEPLSEYVMTLLESGGIKPLVRKQMTGHRK
jgi:3-isopropylmalate/(R)-2-methylmalate dehydratase small subunit